MFADLLALAFATSPDVPAHIVEIATTVAAGIAACDKHQPDVVLLDLGLPDGSGVAVAEHVAATLPDARVIVVSGQASTFVCPPHLASCIQGVVSTADAFDALQGILAAQVAQTSVVQPAAPVSPLVRRRPPARLSRREREVLALVGQQYSSRQIAERIGVSVHTINAHRKNIARKLGVPGTNLPLVAYEYRQRRSNSR